MQLCVQSRRGRVALGITCAFLSTLYVLLIVLIWRADYLENKRENGSLAKSVKLMPWDAEPRWLIGKYFLEIVQNLPEALSNLQQAVLLNPHSAQYWLDLAAAYETVNSRTLETQ